MNPLDSSLRGPDTWTDINGLASLRRAANQDQKAALPAVARQFESAFTQMLLKSMRDASFGGGILDNQQTAAWRDMFDKQVALSLSEHGKGLGIATMLVRQLGGSQAAQSGGTASSELPLSGSAVGGAGGVSAAAAGESGDSTDSGLFGRIGAFAGRVGAAATRVAAHWTPASPREFIARLAPQAEAAAKKLGVSVRAVLAQAALETGWGKHMPRQADGASSFNLFGIKATGNWDGDRVNVPTLEYEDGVAVRRHAAFRAYDAPSQSFDDYARLLSDNPRYAQALGHGEDVAGFARALHRAGYATDPSYAAKLTAIADSPTMREALASLKNSPTLPTGEL